MYSKASGYHEIEQQLGTADELAATPPQGHRGEGRDPPPQPNPTHTDTKPGVGPERCDLRYASFDENDVADCSKLLNSRLFVAMLVMDRIFKIFSKLF